MNWRRGQAGFTSHPRVSAVGNSVNESVTFAQQELACRTAQPGLAQAGRLAARAVRALIAEATLTPKPALVDQRGSGAHSDMNLLCLVRSARALQPAFLKMGLAANGRMPSQALREELGAIGRSGELDMLRATRGINTHRGAIWVMGLLLAAKNMSDPETDAVSVATLAGAVARYVDRFAPVQATNGSRVCARYGVRGARGEAARGFPHVVKLGLPALSAARARGIAERYARLDALMAIMSSLDDTCLLHRGGLPALRLAQLGAQRVLRAGGTSCPTGLDALRELDNSLQAVNASPGGSADLLAACLFLNPALEVFEVERG
jgi:triphosphoribosyl-dephospho-CoA synthase